MHRHTAHIGTGNFNRDILYSASGLTRADYAPIVDIVHPCKQQTYKSPRWNKNLAMARSRLYLRNIQAFKPMEPIGSHASLMLSQ